MRTPKFIFISKNTKPIKIDLKLQIDNFIFVKRTERRSQKTIKAYSHTLNQFYKWIGATSKKVDPDTMRDYINYLMTIKTRWDDHPTSPNSGVGLSARSINNTTRNLRIFFNHLVREEIIPVSPMENIKYQIEENNFKIISEEEIEKLIGAINTKVYTGRRDLCMILVLCDTGLRRGELTELKVSDIDLKMRHITVRAEVSKTNKPRVIPLSLRTASELAKLIEFMGTDDDDYVWLNQFGNRYYADTFAKMLKNYAKIAGISTDNISPHKFRHYACLNLLKSGMDVLAVARILGHSSVDVTRLYARYNVEDIRLQHETASPVSRILSKTTANRRGPRKYK
ncbi:tyrosine-type recombinase/integrase [Paenibacillus sp. YN15]|uniref:tyrosine-type recombinase/integrase n=1 Tax=Paenibacillus sp. YN15 TaxID=1742774 RepID=UPI00215C33D4|nr:tyrosine-type recombinase/integrase [Paenibacillus sp. YN15]